MWTQKKLSLSPKRRGFHLIDDEIGTQLTKIKSYRQGILHLFIQHTSASLAINEKADPTVREDLEAYFDRLVAPRQPYYQHTLEGDDDMPAHIKTCLIGTSLLVPIGDGRLLLGQWQGIYLCEHRDHARARNLIATIHGNA